MDVPSKNILATMDRYIVLVTIWFMGDEEEYLKSVRKDNEEAAEAQEKKERRKKRSKNKN